MLSSSLAFFKKRRIFIILLHRGAHSIGPNRKTNGSSAYHWGLFISDGAWVFESCQRVQGSYIDVTNSIQPLPDQPELLNSDGKWYFRVQRLIPAEEPRLLCMAMIGAVPRNSDVQQIGEELRAVNVPDQNIDGLKQDCVWWVLNAVDRLRELGCIALSSSLDRHMLLRDVPLVANEAMRLLMEGRVKELPLIRDFTGSHCSS